MGFHFKQSEKNNIKINNGGKSPFGWEWRGGRMVDVNNIKITRFKLRIANKLKIIDLFVLKHCNNDFFLFLPTYKQQILPIY